MTIACSGDSQLLGDRSCLLAVCCVALPSESDTLIESSPRQDQSNCSYHSGISCRSSATDADMLLRHDGCSLSILEVAETAAPPAAGRTFPWESGPGQNTTSDGSAPQKLMLSEFRIEGWHISSPLNNHSSFLASL